MNKDILQQAYLLHARPYRDTSLLAELFTLAEGRVSIVARGVRSARSALKSLLQPFAPILAAYAGRGELMSLRRAESAGLAYSLTGNALFSGFYVNELLMRLLHRYEPHPKLYQAYEQVLLQLQQGTNIEPNLRMFEKSLLQELGYALPIAVDAATGEVVSESYYYLFTPEQGFKQAAAESEQAKAQLFKGESLLALQQDNLTKAYHLRDAKRLLRMALAPLLGSKPLKSRELFS